MKLDWLAAQGRANPDGLALIFGEQSWTYAALDREVNGWCGRMAALGLSPGARVAVLLPNGPEYVFLIHALVRLGLVLAPLNMRLSNGELGAQFDLLQLDCLIGAEWGRLASFEAAGRRVLTLENLQALPAKLFTPVPFDLSRPQGLLFTSGTTGAPKAARLTFANHFWSALASASRLGMLPDDRWLSCLPLYHVGGLAVLFRSCLFGSAVELHPNFDIPAIARSGRYTLISLVPTMLYRLLEAGAFFPARLRLILLGGAAASDELLAEVVRLNLPVALTYGLTEAASQAATMPPAGVRQKPGSVGKPLLYLSARILGPEGQELPPGEPGEIALSGPTVMEGYEGDPEATRRTLQGGWLLTGDIGCLDEDGDLWVLQRRSDLIVSGGENVYPAEVESALRKHPAVAEACVVGIPDREWGQRVAAAVVLRGEQEVSAEELLTFTRRHLAGYKQPRLILPVEKLPQTASGKMERKQVQAWLEAACARHPGS
jgi:O-succinylbenzoic acid--CoA ligase